MSLSRRTVLIACFTPLVAMAVLSAGYLIDGALQNGKVVRNVSVAGEDVGGLNRPEMLAQVKRLAEGFPDTPVSITADDLILNTTAGDLGYEIDVNTTVDRAFAQGHQGYSPAKAVLWLSNLFEEYRLPVALTTDQDRLNFTVLALEGDRRTDPVNPAITFAGTTPELTPGIPGRKIDPSSITNQLPGSLNRLGEPIELTATRGTIPTPISDDVMVMIKAQLNNILGTPFTLRAGDQSAEVEPSEIVPLLSVTTKGNKPQVVVDAKAAALLLTDKLPTPSNPTGVRFTLGPNGPAPSAARMRWSVATRPQAPSSPRRSSRLSTTSSCRQPSTAPPRDSRMLLRRASKSRSPRSPRNTRPANPECRTSIASRISLRGCTSLRVGRSRSTTSWGNAPRKRGSSLHR
ncbi:MAG: peptidoglycan binding domain-containing protein [Candidatus Microthrix sp.]|uniref:peptidoglycan binding domain-containing protein n=1 Tax=Candidatus Neomicrothrix sp. TaxID=2719034 RepID=UPI0025BFC47C|nr:peptidoglycan binding domain-containing protein [Candidatus Microthrix sp.]MBL0203115.1 peptidoglycan binding domain-containing protein [Candidatus Microthrix sp.]